MAAGTALHQAEIDLRLTPLQEAMHAEATSSSSPPLQSPAVSAMTPVRMSRRGVAAASPDVSGLDLDLFMPPNLTPRQVLLIWQETGQMILDWLKTITLPLSPHTAENSRSCSQPFMLVDWAF